MKTRRLACCWFAMSLSVAWGVGCGDSESNSKGDSGGIVGGADGGFRDAAPLPDAPVGLDGATTMDTGLAIDSPLVIDASMIDSAPAIDVSTFDSGLVLDSGAIDGPAFDPALCTVLPARFDADTVLPKGCYLAQKSPVIAADVRLTLSPGVIIVFSADTGLSFSANQVLVAAGTAVDPILLTGAVAQRGYWKGITFSGTLTPDSVLDYVTVEYAGSTKADREAAAVKMTADSRGVRASITHTTLRESQGWGLFLGGSAVLGAFGGNVLTKNTLGPASVSVQVVSVLDAASTYTGNDRNELVVTDLDLGAAASWAALDVPYYLTKGVRPAADWTVAAGTTFIMGPEAQIYVGGDAAALVAAGTASKPILFTGAEKTRGYWRGLIFDGSNNARNVLSNVTVEFAGNTKADRDAAAVKLTGDSHGVQVKLSSCVLRQSAAWGLYLTGSAIVPAFTGNRLTQNALGPAKIGSTAAHQLLPQSTYTGNDVDRVQVMADWVSQSVTWSAIGVPYVLDSGIDTQKVWTLAPGVTLLLEKGAGITVGGDEAGFHAVGTAEAPITISGLAKTPGAWESIYFDTTLNAANALDHCIVEYGGGGAAKGQSGMIMAQSDSHGARVTVTNSRIEDSAVYGIWMNNANQITQSGNTFAGNALGDVFVQQ